MSAIERVEFPISMAELERRWAAVRKEMEARNIDALITQNSSDWLGGYVKWFTDVPAHNDYPRNVIFYRDDLMTVVEMGDKDGRNTSAARTRSIPASANGCSARRSSRSATPIDYDGELVAAELKRRGCKTVGWVGKGRLQYDLVRVTEEQAGNVKFVDATDWVDRIKAIKSAEEIALIRRAAAMQDAQWAAILPKIKPGMRDLRADRARAIRRRAARQPAGPVPLLVGAARRAGDPARPALPGPRHAAGRLHDAADREQRARAGTTPSSRAPSCIGKASQELRDAFAVVVDAQKHTVKNLKIGAQPAEIYASHNDYMKSRGAPPEMRLFGHSQGYDLVERPLLRADETMPLAANMNMAVHPGFFKPTNFAFICDNFLIKEDGTVEHLHKSEQKIWEL